MSIHTSLRSTEGIGGSQRNVLKRHERVRHLMANGLWPEGRSVLGLPKIKQAKVRARKAAAKEKEETAATTEKPSATPPA